MTEPADHGEVARSPNQARIWRVLVGAQVAVLALIVVAVIVILVTGLVGSLFTQRAL